MRWWFKKKIRVPVPGIKITYTYGPDQPINEFTYESLPGKKLMWFATTRKFVKWYFGRPQSDSIFITGRYNNQREWRREHIIRIELLTDTGG